VGRGDFLFRGRCFAVKNAGTFLPESALRVSIMFARGCNLLKSFSRVSQKAN
jgi:hypothetical protein